MKQYECVRVALANIYCTDTTLFQPPSLLSSPLFSVNVESLDVEAKCQKQKLLKQRQDEIKEGYQRVQKKLKEVRQNFSCISSQFPNERSNFKAANVYQSISLEYQRIKNRST